ncbi:MAG: YitT family protein [Lachnospiraceae bacterium]|nr:YitT family protein [Lachnospiraceae bacterium]
MKMSRKTEVVNILKIIVGSMCMSIALKLFVKPGEIVPAGFSGIVVLIQNIASRFYNVTLPFGPLNLLLNVPPAIMSLKMIGKKYTFLSMFVLIEISVLTDLIPSVVLSDDVLILAIFNAFGVSLVLSSGTSTGGTDFIAMSLSNRYHISTFNYVMGFNILLILIQGVLFGFSKSFYSIIYQYVNTQVINMRYKHYEKKTLLIVSEKTEEVINAIIKELPHSVTKIPCEGGYTKEKKNILYAITTTPELRKTISIVKNTDKNAFINVIDSKAVEGNFNYLPVDVPENKVGG